MARDGQIRLGDGGSPQSYTVPNAAEIIPKVITATFVGSGAASSFVPTVEYVSDGGVVVARVPCQTTVVAGDSAEVTFAPFLRKDAASAAAAGLGTWAGQWIDLTGTPGVLFPVPSAGQPYEPFHDINGELFFRTDDTVMWSLFTTDRIHGDPGLVVHKGDTAYLFYAEAGALMAPQPPATWADITLEHAAESIYVGMEYTGPDISIDPASATQPTTSLQTWRAEYPFEGTAIDQVWFNRNGLWIDNGTAGDDWTLALFFTSLDSSNPNMLVYEAYLHVYAVPVNAALITQTIPIGS